MYITVRDDPWLLCFYLFHLYLRKECFECCFTLHLTLPPLCLFLHVALFTICPLWFPSTLYGPYRLRFLFCSNSFEFKLKIVSHPWPNTILYSDHFCLPNSKISCKLEVGLPWHLDHYQIYPPTKTLNIKYFKWNRWYPSCQRTPVISVPLNSLLNPMDSVL